MGAKNQEPYNSAGRRGLDKSNSSVNNFLEWCLVFKLVEKISLSVISRGMSCDVKP